MRKDLREMDIRKYPGEDISKFNTDAIQIIKEIKMNYVSEKDVPNLVVDTLAGLEKCSVRLHQGQGLGNQDEEQ